MHVGAIKLTAEEQATLTRIHLRAHGDHAEYLQNREIIPAFVKTLVARGAIPQHRLAYFTKPEYNTGRSKGSHQDMFERRDNSGDEILEHPHFLKYLRYFLFGAELPAKIVAGFSERVKELGMITSGDLRVLCELAREQLNTERLEPSTTAEEFFKLCLDCGLSAMQASHIRDVIARMKLRTTA